MKYYKDSHNQIYAFEFDGSQDHIIPENLVEISARTAELLLQEKNQIKWEDVKRIRNKLLQESDWTDLPNSPVDNRPAWQAYRQRLRDVTKDFPNPWEINWPTKP